MSTKLRASRETILAFKDKPQTREVEFFGGTVTITELTAGELKALGRKQEEIKENNIHANAYYIVGSVLDENGQRMFSDSDLEAINNLPVSEVNKVARAIADLNGLTEEAASKIQKN